MPLCQEARIREAGPGWAYGESRALQRNFFPPPPPPPTSVRDANFRQDISAGSEEKLKIFSHRTKTSQMKHDIIFKFTHEALQYIFAPDNSTDYACKRKINISENCII